MKRFCDRGLSDDVIKLLLGSNRDTTLPQQLQVNPRGKAGLIGTRNGIRDGMLLALSTVARV